MSLTFLNNNRNSPWLLTTRYRNTMISTAQPAAYMIERAINGLDLNDSIMMREAYAELNLLEEKEGQQFYSPRRRVDLIKQRLNERLNTEVTECHAFCFCEGKI